MRRELYVLLCGMIVFGFISDVSAHWVTKDGYEDYAQHMVLVPGQPPMPMYIDGMPDFDQKQDAWMNQFNQWNWCGPVAVGNCLWWFDSKFEMIKGKSLPPGSIVRPPAISDHYNLVYAMLAGFDDHDPLNVIPYITLLGNQVPGGIGAAGITPPQMKGMIESYIAQPQVGLYGHYKVRIIWQPTFEQIYEEVEQSQDVIVLFGFWQMNNAGMWTRFGGHYLTVAGVDSQNSTQTLSLCDPMRDAAEMGWPGIVWNGWLNPHVYPPPHPANIHNDAGNVSHDHYSLAGSGSPGGVISPVNYGSEFGPEFWENFQGQNTPDPLQQYQGMYSPDQPVHTELEAIVVVCPNFDYGDLGQDYPTIDIESCGPAHPLSDKAWLGECIDAEIQPNIYDLDPCDDGVNFVDLPWTPGDMEQVDVFVNTGPHYQNESLYLNAWKDGNHDGDFDDISFDDGVHCDEWLIHDASVAPGLSSHTFCDPGLLTFNGGGPYDLIIRFRLTSQPVGRYGYGGYWGGGNSNGLGTYDIDWVLGEVEDYDSTDMQLAVELQSFVAIGGDGRIDLEWVTASESDVTYFKLERSSDGFEWIELAQVPSQGNSSTPQYYMYSDHSVANGRLYTYQISARDLNGSLDLLDVASATPWPISLPVEFALEQNYPNPFNANTEIRFALPEDGDVTLTVYNVTGQLVSTLIDAYLTAGYYNVSFDASGLTSGIYLYTIKTKSHMETRKMVLIR